MIDAAATRAFGVSTQDVAAIDTWIEQVTAPWSASEQAVFRARLCIAELAANVVEHGGPTSSSDRIVITLRNVGDGVEVEFLDSRKPFDPTANVPEAKPEPSETGELGLMLVRSYADELSYSNDGTYNRLRLKIRSALKKTA